MIQLGNCGVFVFTCIVTFSYVLTRTSCVPLPLISLPVIHSAARVCVHASRWWKHRFVGLPFIAALNAFDLFEELCLLVYPFLALLALFFIGCLWAFIAVEWQVCRSDQCRLRLSNVQASAAVLCARCHILYSALGWFACMSWNMQLSLGSIRCGQRPVMVGLSLRVSNASVVNPTSNMQRNDSKYRLLWST